MANRILTVERRFWQPGQAPPAAMRGKVYQATKDTLGYADPAAAILRDGIDQTEMSVPAVISTMDIDRADDVMVPEGCQLENFGRNPVVFFNHQDVPLPIAYARSRAPERKLQVAIEPGKRVVSRAYFVQTGKWAEEAATFFELILEGAINMTSIGFSPREWVNIENSYGRRYIAWELLEWSFCGVPCNPYCEVVRSYLSNHRNLKPAVRKALEPLAAPLKAWAPGHTPDPSEAAVKNKTKRVPFGKVALAKMQAAALKAKQTAQAAAAQQPANQDLAAAAAKVTAVADAVSKAFPPSDNAPPDPAADDGKDDAGDEGSDTKPDLAGVVGQLTEAITALAEMVQPAAPAAPPTPPGADAPALDEEDEDSDPNPIDADGSAGVGNEPATPAEDEENSEELLDEYRNPPKKPPKSGKPRGKVMSNDQRAICREATEFLGEHAGEANLSKVQKAACKHHAGCLGKMLKDLEAGPGDEAPAAAADDGKRMDPAADLDATAILAALQPVVEGQKKLDDKFYALTGKSL